MYMCIFINNFVLKDMLISPYEPLWAGVRQELRELARES